MSRQRLHMHGLEEASSGQMSQTSRVIAIGLVSREGLERLIRLPALDTDHGKTQLAKPRSEAWRWCSGSGSLVHSPPPSSTRLSKLAKGSRVSVWQCEV